jgi:hypothetical protein
VAVWSTGLGLPVPAALSCSLLTQYSWRYHCGAIVRISGSVEMVRNAVATAELAVDEHRPQRARADDGAAAAERSTRQMWTKTAIEIYKDAVDALFKPSWTSKDTLAALLRDSPPHSLNSRASVS